MTPCPDCNQEMDSAAAVCHACGKEVKKKDVFSEINNDLTDLSEKLFSAAKKLNNAPGNITGGGSQTCPSCNKMNNPTFNACWNCGNKLTPKQPTVTQVHNRGRNKSRSLWPFLGLYGACLLVLIGVDLKTPKTSWEMLTLHYFVILAGLTYGVHLVAALFFKKNTLTNTLTDNFDPDPILEKVSQKYGGTYQTDEKTFVEFSLKGRKFFVAPDIETSQISLLGSDVTGMSFSCSVRSHFTFWIVQNDLFDNPFDTAGDTKCRHKIGKFLLITNDVKIQNILLENKKFLKHIDSLSEGMYFLSVRDQKNLWYANQTYQDGMIEKMNDLAQVVEEIVIS